MASTHKYTTWHIHTILSQMSYSSLWTPNDYLYTTGSWLNPSFVDVQLRRIPVSSYSKNIRWHTLNPGYLWEQNLDINTYKNMITLNPNYLFNLLLKTFNSFIWYRYHESFNMFLLTICCWLPFGYAMRLISPL